MALGKGKTEHGGPRDTGRKHGHWGTTEEAKAWASRARRRDEKEVLGREVGRTQGRPELAVLADLEHPWGRAAVLDGLRVMVSLDPGTPERDWEFTEAVHGVIDDTWWHEGDPSKDVRRILVDEAEAASARVAVRDLMAVLDALGPTAPYDDYLLHPGWGTARASMQGLLDLMEAAG